MTDTKGKVGEDNVTLINDNQLSVGSYCYIGCDTVYGVIIEIIDDNMYKIIDLFEQRERLVNKSRLSLIEDGETKNMVSQQYDDYLNTIAMEMDFDPFVSISNELMCCIKFHDIYPYIKSQNIHLTEKIRNNGVDWDTLEPQLDIVRKEAAKFMYARQYQQWKYICITFFAIGCILLWVSSMFLVVVIIIESSNKWYYWISVVISGMIFMCIAGCFLYHAKGIYSDCEKNMGHRFKNTQTVKYKSQIKWMMKYVNEEMNFVIWVDLERV